MPAERYYIDTPLNEGMSVPLEGQEFHHMAHVMRSKEGDPFELVNGKGTLAGATLERLEKKKAILSVISSRKAPEPTTQLILAQAIPRLNRLDFIVEKGTELGMTELQLFPGVLSERKTLTEHQLERLHAVTIAAMKQCGSLYLPNIVSAPGLSSWQPTGTPLFFGDTNPKAPLFKEIWKTERPGSRLIFAVGPESGFTEQEEQRLRELGGIGVRLHENILRTDTAALCGLSLLSHWMVNTEY